MVAASPEADLYAALDAMAAHEGAPTDMIRAYIEQSEFELARDAIREWLMQSGARLPAQALQALARADMALTVARLRE